MSEPIAPNPPSQADAAQAPRTVRRALLPRPVVVHGLTLQFTFDLMILLQEIGHPLCTPSELAKVADGAAEVSFSNLQLAQLIYAMAAPAEAIELATLPAEDGARWTPYDQAALKFLGTRGITPAQMRDLSRAAGQLYVEELAAAPGAGGGNPPEAAAG